MEDILKGLHEKDPSSRVEFSCLNKNKVLCWVCYKDGKKFMFGCESGRNHKEALQNTIKNMKE